jgi:hypothetical protein
MLGRAVAVPDNDEWNLETTIKKAGRALTYPDQPSQAAL